MIARNTDLSTDVNRFLTSEESSRIMRKGVEQAKADLRAHGVPIAKDPDENGLIRFELPDGTIVDSDPWMGKPYAPDGWFERFNIPPENIPAPSRRHIESQQRGEA